MPRLSSITTQPLIGLGITRPLFRLIFDNVDPSHNNVDHEYGYTVAANDTYFAVATKSIQDFFGPYDGNAYIGEVWVYDYDGNEIYNFANPSTVVPASNYWG